MYEEEFIEAIEDNNFQLCSKFIYDIEWFYISSENLNLFGNLLESSQNELNEEIWLEISRDANLSDKFLDKYKNELDWSEVSRYQNNFSEELIEKYQDRIDWDYIPIYQKLSEEFIERHQDKIEWKYISLYQQLSWEFISKFCNRLNIVGLLHNNYISQDIKDRLEQLQIFK